MHDGSQLSKSNRHLSTLEAQEKAKRGSKEEVVLIKVVAHAAEGEKAKEGRSPRDIEGVPAVWPFQFVRGHSQSNCCCEEGKTSWTVMVPFPCCDCPRKEKTRGEERLWNEGGKEQQDVRRAQRLRPEPLLSRLLAQDTELKCDPQVAHVGAAHSNILQ
eukprot:CAMPEP_0178460204 /NCGR_PEP_ID=MMETSP0689_2-20121128/48562_1 /TAXON_ID=160604 /ORGANISM="Amphidinium massartii, Strain CS-259" /LENGTH=158 /DNA_ID=CAMNT_0020086779 /DNA_START=271 /DNA_END=748 /DNA_ORIENTATION=-